jgi:hypothetical protein
MSALMMGADLDAEPEAELVQRRWFAAMLATRRLETECRQLLNALRQADQAWRRACTELAEFETLTDALEEQLSGPDMYPVRAVSAA